MTLDFILIVLVLPVLALLVTGPGMWSEQWGWRVLEAIERWWERAVRKAP